MFDGRFFPLIIILLLRTSYSFSANFPHYPPFTRCWLCHALSPPFSSFPLIVVSRCCDSFQLEHLHHLVGGYHLSHSLRSLSCSFTNLINEAIWTLLGEVTDKEHQMCVFLISAKSEQFHLLNVATAQKGKEGTKMRSRKKKEETIRHSINHQHSSHCKSSLHHCM